MLLNPFASQTGNSFLGKRDKSRNLPCPPGLHGAELLPPLVFISICIFTCVLPGAGGRLPGPAGSQVPVVSGPATCSQPHGQQLAEVGAAGGHWEEGALLRAGFREDKCRMGASPPSRREVALWGGVDLSEAPLRWKGCCRPQMLMATLL